MRRADDQAIGPEGGQPHAHLTAADARVHDLAQSLIVEAGVRESGDAEVRLVQRGAPGPDPVCIITFGAGSRGRRQAGGEE